MAIQDSEFQRVRNKVRLLETNNNDDGINLSGSLTLANNLKFNNAGSGIDFSITGDGTGIATSEILSDYEEGTFTPRLVSGASTFTYYSDGTKGYYTKIGNVVYYKIALSLMNPVNLISGNNLVIVGLPFIAAVGQKGWNPSYCSYVANLSVAKYTVSGEVEQNTDCIYIKCSSGANFYPFPNLLSHEISSTFAIVMSGFYFIP